MQSELFLSLPIEPQSIAIDLNSNILILDKQSGNIFKVEDNDLKVSK